LGRKGFFIGRLLREVMLFLNACSFLSGLHASFFGFGRGF
jgi:hypothetical protein